VLRMLLTHLVCIHRYVGDAGRSAGYSGELLLRKPRLLLTGIGDMVGLHERTSCPNVAVQIAVPLTNTSKSTPIAPLTPAIAIQVHPANSSSPAPDQLLRRGRPGLLQTDCGGLLPTSSLFRRPSTRLLSLTMSEAPIGMPCLLGFLRSLSHSSNLDTLQFSMAERVSSKSATPPRTSPNFSTRPLSVDRSCGRKRRAPTMT
jgi:hypothetical protein